MKLTKDQKKAVAEIIQTAIHNYRRAEMNAKLSDEQKFYSALVDKAELLLPIFTSQRVIEIEEEEAEQEEEND